MLVLVLPRTLYPPCEDGSHEMQSLQDHDVPPVEYPYVSVFGSCSTSPSSHFVMSHSDGRLTTGLCHFPGGSEAHAKSDAFRLLSMQSNNNRSSQE